MDTNNATALPTRCRCDVVCRCPSRGGASRRHLLVLGLCCIAVALAGAALAVLS